MLPEATTPIVRIDPHVQPVPKEPDAVMVTSPAADSLLKSPTENPVVGLQESLKVLRINRAASQARNLTANPLQAHPPVLSINSKTTRNPSASGERLLVSSNLKVNPPNDAEPVSRIAI
jgi:hypothetical protein